MRIRHLHLTLYQKDLVQLHQKPLRLLHPSRLTDNKPSNMVH